MAITFIAVAGGGGTTSANPGLPTGWAVGDGLLVMVVNKPYTSTPTVTGFGGAVYTTIGTAVTGTSTANGTDVGDIRTTAFFKEAVSGEPAPTISTTSGSPTYAWVHAYRKGFGTWQVAGAGGGDTTSGTGFSVVIASDPGFTTGDWVACMIGIPGDNATVSAASLSIPGVTLGTMTQQTVATTQGNDARMASMRAPVASGTSSGAATVACTLSVAHTGSTFVTRLREVVPFTYPIDSAGTSFTAGSASLSIAGGPGTHDISASGNAVAAGSAAMRMTIALGQKLVSHDFAGDADGSILGRETETGGRVWSQLSPNPAGQPSTGDPSILSGELQPAIRDEAMYPFIQSPVVPDRAKAWFKLWSDGTGNTRKVGLHYYRGNNGSTGQWSGHFAFRQTNFTLEAASSPDDTQLEPFSNDAGVDSSGNWPSSINLSVDVVHTVQIERVGKNTLKFTFPTESTKAPLTLTDTRVTSAGGGNEVCNVVPEVEYDLTTEPTRSFTKIEVDYPDIDHGYSTSTGNAAATLSAPLVIAATGASTTTGAGSVTVYAAVAAAGASTSSGAAAVTMQAAVAATGSSTSSGDAALAHTHTAAASGALTSAGSAAVAIPYPVDATGTSASTGTAELAATAGVVADGSSTSAGSAALTVSLPVAAVGVSTSSGSAAASTSGVAGMSADGASTTAGSAEAVVVAVVAADGATTSAGDAAVTVLAPISGAALSQTAGVAALTALLTLAGAGGSTSSGAAVAARSVVVTPAAGASSTAGSAAATVAGFVAITSRPNTGTTARPSSGITSRP